MYRSEISGANYGQVIKDIIKKEELPSMREMAMRSNLAPTTLQNWANMEHSPDLEHLCWLLNTFGYRLEVVKNGEAVEQG